jgi:sugar/nucleoside kinase (ribokinase family)
MHLPSPRYRVSKAYRTSTSHILSTPDGERTIIMGPASTSQLDAAKVEEEFGALIPSCAMITTEISQVRCCWGL